MQPDEEWDDSVVALLNYPEVVEMMNDDLDWTYDLGTAVLNQRADVLNADARLPRSTRTPPATCARDDRQTVARDDGEITIKPANPQVIYVPYYEPERVVIYQTRAGLSLLSAPLPRLLLPVPRALRVRHGLFLGRAQLVLDRLALAPRARSTTRATAAIRITAGATTTRGTRVTST